MLQFPCAGLEGVPPTPLGAGRSAVSVERRLVFDTPVQHHTQRPHLYPVQQQQQPQDPDQAGNRQEAAGDGWEQAQVQGTARMVSSPGGEALLLPEGAQLDDVIDAALEAVGRTPHGAGRSSRGGSPGGHASDASSCGSAPGPVTRQQQQQRGSKHTAAEDRGRGAVGTWQELEELLSPHAPAGRRPALLAGLSFLTPASKVHRPAAALPAARLDVVAAAPAAAAAAAPRATHGPVIAAPAGTTLRTAGSVFVARVLPRLGQPDDAFPSIFAPDADGVLLGAESPVAGQESAEVGGAACCFGTPLLLHSASPARPAKGKGRGRGSGQGAEDGDDESSGSREASPRPSRLQRTAGQVLGPGDAGWEPRLQQQDQGLGLDQGWEGEQEGGVDVAGSWARDSGAQWALGPEGPESERLLQDLKRELARRGMQVGDNADSMDGLRP